MIYTEAVEYIHSLLKFGIRPGLNGMDALLHFLGDPHKDLKYVHVAGTNGKGSTSTAISNVLTDAGYKVGLYTSPYVTDFLERVQFCGKPIDKSLFAKCVEKVKFAVEELEKQEVIITEFEEIAFSSNAELFLSTISFSSYAVRSITSSVLYRVIVSSCILALATK